MVLSVPCCVVLFSSVGCAIDFLQMFSFFDVPRTTKRFEEGQIHTNAVSCVTLEYNPRCQDWTHPSLEELIVCQTRSCAGNRAPHTTPPCDRMEVALLPLRKCLLDRSTPAAHNTGASNIKLSDDVFSVHFTCAAYHNLLSHFPGTAPF